MPEDNTNQLPPEVQQMLAEQLRDVHLPEAISWWPLAWGWWVILIVLFLVIATSLLAAYRKRAKNRYRSLAMTALETAYGNWTKNQNSKTYLHQVNDVLKRCVLHVSESARLTTYTGPAWVEELNKWGKKPLSEKTQNALGVECYQANPPSDINALHRELMHWLRTHEYHLDNEASINNAAINKTSIDVKRGEHA